MHNVYFVAADGAIKIGYTSNVGSRMATLQTGCASKLKLLAVYPGANRAIEKRLHALFQPFRLEGEWFRDTRAIRRFAALIAGGARPTQATQMAYLLDLAQNRTVNAGDSVWAERVSTRAPTIMPSQFVGTPQGNLIDVLDAMVRNPELPKRLIGRAHAALRQALKGTVVDIPNSTVQ